MSHTKVHNSKTFPYTVNQPVQQALERCVSAKRESAWAKKKNIGAPLFFSFAHARSRISRSRTAQTPVVQANSGLGNLATTTATGKPQNNNFYEQKQSLCTCISTYFGTFPCNLCQTRTWNIQSRGFLDS